MFDFCVNGTLPNATCSLLRDAVLQQPVLAERPAALCRATQQCRCALRVVGRDLLVAVRDLTWHPRGMALLDCKGTSQK